MAFATLASSPPPMAPPAIPPTPDDGRHDTGRIAAVRGACGRGSAERDVGTTAERIAAPPVEAAETPRPLIMSVPAGDGTDDLRRLVARLLAAWGVRDSLTDSIAAWPAQGGVLDVAAVAARHRLAATRLGPVDLADLRAIDLPAIVEVQEPGGRRPYLVLSIDRDAARLATPTGAETRVTLGSFETSWTRAAWIIWRNNDGLPTGSVESWTPAMWAAVASRLRSLGYFPPTSPGSGEEDRLTQAVRRFQAAAGLRSDGVLGPLTVLALARTAAPPLDWSRRGEQGAAQ